MVNTIPFLDNCSLTAVWGWTNERIVNRSRDVPLDTPPSALAQTKKKWGANPPSLPISDGPGHLRLRKVNNVLT